jgi:carotenoid cleavage dioxygenase
MTATSDSAVSTVDSSTNAFLAGRFAPVHDEIDVGDLRVAGTIPNDLEGGYLRNGPNPEFAPLGSYTYPLEGDGMIHGVWIEGGTARYCNRFVRTQSLLAEERAGRALFGGIMTPAFVDTALLGDDPDPGWPFKLDAFVNIVRHHDRYLALEEGTVPYEIGSDLSTVGRYDFGGGLSAGMCAHPKIDPITGEMIVFRYDLEAPFLSWAVIGADGTVTQPATAVDGVDRGFMIHDFAITSSSIVLVVAPLVFDFSLLGSGSPLEWQPELGTRIAIIPRDGSGPTRWVEGEALWAWHYANAYDDGDVIRLDLPWTSAPSLMIPAGQRAAVKSGFTRATLDPTRGSITLDHLDEAGYEFPRIDDRRTGVEHRYVTLLGRSDHAGLAGGEHDRIIRWDMATGSRTHVDTGAAIGEVTFAPRANGTDELDGYLMGYGTDLATDVAGLYIWEAAAFPAPPVAVIEIPARVPNGLHGNWFPDAA